MSSLANRIGILQGAHEESEELSDIIESSLVRQISNQVSGFILAMDVALEVKADLEQILCVTIRQIVSG